MQEKKWENAAFRGIEFYYSQEHIKKVQSSKVICKKAELNFLALRNDGQKCFKNAKIQGTT